MKKLLPALLLLLVACSDNTKPEPEKKDSTALLIIDRQPGSITFKVDNVKKAPFRLIEFKASDVFAQKAEKSIFICPSDSQHTKLVPSYYNTFADAIHVAYAEHRPLRISPDVIWLQLLQGFSIHVNTNYEQLKDQVFVSDEVKTISINDERLVAKKPEDWGNLIFSFCDSVKKYTRNNIGDAVLKKYSTTGKKEQVVFGITLLESVKKGFRLEATSLCGIPEITLEGTTADWEQLKKNAGAFRKFGLEKWIDNLDPVLEQFIKASKGEIDSVFWQQIYKTSTVYGKKYISGWMLKFFPYVKEREETDAVYPNPYMNDDNYCFSKITSKELPESFSTIEITWIKGKSDKTPLHVYAGFTAIEQDAKTGSLKPYISWFICKKDAPEISENHYLQRNDPEEKEMRHKENEYMPFPFDTLRLMPVYDSANGSKTYGEGLEKIKKQLREAIIKKQGSNSMLKKIQVQAILTWSGVLVEIKTDASAETDIIIKEELHRLPGEWIVRKAEDKTRDMKYTNVRIRFTLEP